MNPSGCWIVTADARRASLFACQRTPEGELHLERVRGIESSHEDEHAHGRPGLLGGSERTGSGARSGARAAPHAFAAGHEAEEEQRRFAKEVCAWLANAAGEICGARVSIFAPARMGWLLRGELGSAGARGAKLQWHEAELAHLQPGRLAVHPAVRNAMAL